MFTIVNFHCVKMGHMMTLWNHSEKQAAHYSHVRASYQPFNWPFRLGHISTVFPPVQYVYFSTGVFCSSMLCTLRAAVGQCVDVSRCIWRETSPILMISERERKARGCDGGVLLNDGSAQARVLCRFGRSWSDTFLRFFMIFNGPYVSGYCGT